MIIVVLSVAYFFRETKERKILTRQGVSITDVSAPDASEENCWMKGLPRVAFLGVSKGNLPGQVGASDSLESIDQSLRVGPFVVIPG